MCIRDSSRVLCQRVCVLAPCPRRSAPGGPARNGQHNATATAGEELTVTRLARHQHMCLDEYPTAFDRKNNALTGSVDGRNVR
eukprot:7205570-Alexandrium_andersonii.AAC.1